MRFERKNALPLLSIVMLVVAGTLAWLFWLDRSIAPRRATSEPVGATNKATERGAALVSRIGDSFSNNKLSAAAGALKRAVNAADSRQSLSELRNYLASLSPDDASRVIRAFLDSADDAPTHLGFAI